MRNTLEPPLRLDNQKVLNNKSTKNLGESQELSIKNILYNDLSLNKIDRKIFFCIIKIFEKQWLKGLDFANIRQETLAKKFSLSRFQVIRALKKLKNQEYISSEKIGKINIYRVNFKSLSSRNSHLNRTSIARIEAWNRSSEESSKPPPINNSNNSNNEVKRLTNSRYLGTSKTQENEKLVSFLRLIKEKGVTFLPKERIELIDQLLKRYKITSEELFKILTDHVKRYRPKSFSGYLAATLLRDDLDLRISDFVETKERKLKGLATKKEAEKAFKAVDQLRINNPKLFKELAKPLASRWNYDLNNDYDKQRLDYMIETQEAACMVIYKQMKNKNIEVLK